MWLGVLSLPCWFWAARPHLHRPGPGLPPAEGVPSLHVEWVPSAAWPCARADSDERPSAAPVINSASESSRSSRLGAAVWFGSFSGSVTPLPGAGVPRCCTVHSAQPPSPFLASMQGWGGEFMTPGLAWCIYHRYQPRPLSGSARPFPRPRVPPGPPKNHGHPPLPFGAPVSLCPSSVCTALRVPVDTSLCHQPLPWGCGWPSPERCLG